MEAHVADGSGAHCPRCHESLVAQVMRTAIWHGRRVAIVEDIPAMVCPACDEQYYDGPVSDALRRLAEDGFPEGSAQARVTVPVFSLKGRIRKAARVAEDAYVD